MGLDGSPREPWVRRTAVQLADRLGGRLVLVRVVRVPPGIPAALLAFGDDEFRKFLVEHARTELGSIAEGLPEGIVADTVCCEGSAADILCQIAKERRADLIVIGTHGYDRVDRVLGTTAARVSNLAPCSVMVVREDGRSG